VPFDNNFSSKEERVLFMQRVFLASGHQKRVLKYYPKREHCLNNGQLENLKHLNDVVVFIWLKNGNGFWYYLHYANDNMLIGHILRGNWWYYRAIPQNAISSYY
jgi:hypothetical protein